MISRLRTKFARFTRVEILMALTSISLIIMASVLMWQAFAPWGWPLAVVATLQPFLIFVLTCITLGFIAKPTPLPLDENNEPL